MEFLTVEAQLGAGNLEFRTVGSHFEARGLVGISPSLCDTFLAVTLAAGNRISRELGLCNPLFWWGGPPGSLGAAMGEDRIFVCGWILAVGTTDTNGNAAKWILPTRG